MPFFRHYRAWKSCIMPHSPSPQIRFDSSPFPQIKGAVDDIIHCVFYWHTGRDSFNQGFARSSPRRRCLSAPHLIFRVPFPPGGQKIRGIPRRVSLLFLVHRKGLEPSNKTAKSVGITIVLKIRCHFHCHFALKNCFCVVFSRSVDANNLYFLYI